MNQSVNHRKKLITNNLKNGLKVNELSSMCKHGNSERETAIGEIYIYYMKSACTKLRLLRCSRTTNTAQ